MSQQAQGATAENQALQYLLDQGLRLVERNYRCKLGELDLIMRDGSSLVFVEVRSRRSATRFGSPLETVTARKQQCLIRAAQHYLQCRHLDLPCRFDVVGIQHTADTVQVDWVSDAFQAY